MSPRSATSRTCRTYRVSASSLSGGSGLTPCSRALAISGNWRHACRASTPSRSNGRLAPRFYIRGLGNTDFDLAASQPVSIIVDDVVLGERGPEELPLFDIDRVEVLRGPQGTLVRPQYPGGIVNFVTVKPKAGFDGDVGLSYGELRDYDRGRGDRRRLRPGSSGRGRPVPRAQRLHRQQLPFSAPDTPTGNDAIGGFEEYAYRAQLLFSPSDA